MANHQKDRLLALVMYFFLLSSPEKNKKKKIPILLDNVEPNHNHSVHSFPIVFLGAIPDTPIGSPNYSLCIKNFKVLVV